VTPDCRGLGGGHVLAQLRQIAGCLQGSGIAPDSLAEFLDRAGQIALRGGQPALCKRDGGLGLRHVGARHLADLEPILGRAQFLAQQALVVFAQLDEFAVSDDVHVGPHRGQKHRLLDADQRLARGQNGFLGGVDQQIALAEIIKQKPPGDRDIGVGGRIGARSGGGSKARN